MQLTGVATNNTTGTPLENGFVNLISYPDASLGNWFVRTDSYGKFSLDRMDFSDSLALSVNAHDAEGNAVQVQLDFSGKSEKHVIEIVQKPIGEEVRKNLDSYLVARQQGYDESGLSKTMTPVQNSRQSIFGKADQRVSISIRGNQSGNLVDFFQTREPGTEVTTSGRVMLKGDAVEPLLLVDGFLANPEALDFAGNNMIDLKIPDGRRDEVLSMTPIQQFDRVEVYKKTPGLKFYGVEWNHGVIAVYSKTGIANFEVNASEGKSLVWLQGYAQPKSANLPDYSKINSSGPDLRTTVYWNPDVKVNKKGRVKISFYNSDDAKTLQVCVQGITSAGIPVFELFDIGKNSGRTR